MLALIASVLLCCGIGCYGRNSSSITIRYFPFETETLTPVTAQNICERSRPCVLRSPQDVYARTRED
jgi:hypothetical protein